ncbi:MAG: hypothetical protein AAFV53_26045 [Myxococcota bacterium]
MSDPLSDLLLHDDPLVRSQGLELGRAVSPSRLDAALSGLELDAQGWLYAPPSGWSLEMLELIMDRVHVARWGRRLRGVGLHHQALLPILERLPVDLAALDLSFSGIHDLAPLRRFPRLRWLSLHACRVFDVEPLADLAALEFLDLSKTPVRSLPTLRRLSSLRELDLSMCSLAEGLRFVPAGVRSLWMSESSLLAPLQIADRPLEHLSAAWIEWMPQRERLPKLQTLALDRGDPGVLRGWPVVRLWLRDRATASLSELSSLRWLRLHEQPVPAPSGLPAALEVLETRWRSGMCWPEGVTAAPSMLRRLGAVQNAALRRSADQWRARGHDQMLLARSDPRANRLRTIRTLNKVFLWKMDEATRLLNQLADGRLVCLTMREATRLQGVLSGLGVLTGRQRWSADDS